MSICAEAQPQPVALWLDLGHLRRVDARCHDLLQHLARHIAASAAETAHLAAIRRLLADSAAPFDRGQYVPGHVTASAFVVDASGQNLLLIYHQKLQRWLQPGGHVEAADADIEAAARREVLEEAGLAALQLHPRRGGIFDVDVHVIPARPTEPAHAHFDVRFLFVAPAGEVRPASDALAARWFSSSEVAAIDSDASVMRAVKKLRRLNSAC